MTEDEFGKEIDKLVQKIQVLEMRVALETKAKLELSVEVMEWREGIRRRQWVPVAPAHPQCQWPEDGPMSPIGLGRDV